MSVLTIQVRHGEMPVYAVDSFDAVYLFNQLRVAHQYDDLIALSKTYSAQYGAVKEKLQELYTLQGMPKTLCSKFKLWCRYRWAKYLERRYTRLFDTVQIKTLVLLTSMLTHNILVRVVMAGTLEQVAEAYRDVAEFNPQNPLPQNPVVYSALLTPINLNGIYATKSLGSGTLEYCRVLAVMEKTEKEPLRYRFRWLTGPEKTTEGTATVFYQVDM